MTSRSIAVRGVWPRRADVECSGRTAGIRSSGRRGVDGSGSGRTAGLCSNVRLTAMTAGENAPTAENESRKAIEISSHGVRWHDRLSRANRKDIVKAQCRALPRAVPWSVGSTSLASSKRASKIDRPATDSESRSRRYICACAARRSHDASRRCGCAAGKSLPSSVRRGEAAAEHKQHGGGQQPSWRPRRPHARRDAQSDCDAQYNIN